MQDRFSEEYIPNFAPDLKIGMQGEAFVFHIRNLLRSNSFYNHFAIIERIDDDAVAVTYKRLDERQKQSESPVENAVNVATDADKRRYTIVVNKLIAKFKKHLPAGYNPHFDLERTTDEPQEDLLKMIASGSVEVKSDVKAPMFGNVFLETECLHNGVWCSSGVTKTIADVWAHIIGFGSVIVFIRTDTLRKVVEHAVDRNLSKSMNRGDHPTKAVAIPYAEFMNMVRTVTIKLKEVV